MIVIIIIKIYFCKSKICLYSHKAQGHIGVFTLLQSWRQFSTVLQEGWL